MQSLRNFLLLAVLLGLQTGGIASAAQSGSATKPSPAAPPSPVVQQSASAQASTVPVAEISLYVGEVKTMPITRIQRIAIGNGRLFTTNMLEKELLMLGEAPGRTSMFIWTADGKEQRYSVTVLGNDNADTQRRLAALLASMPGVRVDRWRLPRILHLAAACDRTGSIAIIGAEVVSAAPRFAPSSLN